MAREPVKVERYYSREYRTWVGFPVDAEGNQTADCVYEYRKVDIPMDPNNSAYKKWEH